MIALSHGCLRSGVCNGCVWQHCIEISATQYHRSVTVLRRPVVSFRDCVPTRPASLSIGSDPPLELVIEATELDNANAPWEVPTARR